MNTITIGGIIISTAGVLILGMAALIKSMVVGKLDALQAGLDSMRSDLHHLELRLTKIETEHGLSLCHRRKGDE